MTNLVDLVEEIIKDLDKLKDAPVSRRSNDDLFPFPRMISAGNGQSLFVSRKIDGDIRRVAQSLLDDDPALKRKFMQAEWYGIVRRAFGPALSSVNLDEDVAESAHTVLRKVKKSLECSTSGSGPREFSFGCTLFEDARISPFSVGPVRFEIREDWLARKRRENSLSAVSQARIERAWHGKKQRKRKSSFDNICESDVLDAVDGCQFVCSVATNDLAAEAGREKALTAGRLATAVIALTWQIPSRALDGINLAFDRKPHRRAALSFAPVSGVRPLAGRSSHSLHN